MPDSAPYLPPEIILHIFSYLPRGHASQSTYHAATLVSRDWYAAAVPLLYRYPHFSVYRYPRFSGKKYQSFVATICPSVNAHVRQSALAGFVRKLDVSRLVHDGSKSLTARVLGRLKDNLEEYIAPQTSFSINCFAALSKCSHLTHLDLSMLSVSVTLADLFHALKSLDRLSSLCFPRTSVQEKNFTSDLATWPPNLQSLDLGDGISRAFYANPGRPPASLVSLTFSTHSLEPYRHLTERHGLLYQLGPQLLHLTVSPYFSNLLNPRLGDYGDFPYTPPSFLCELPNLLTLRVGMEFLRNELLDGRYRAVTTADNTPFPLECLTIDGWPTDDPGRMAAENPLYASRIERMISNSRWGNIRRVRVSERLGLQEYPILMAEVRELVDFLEALEAKDRGLSADTEDVGDESEEDEGTDGGPSTAGVWIFPDPD